MKSWGGLSSKCSFLQQLISQDYSSYNDLAQSYNDFLVGLTEHFDPLISNGTTNDDLVVPDRLLVRLVLVEFFLPCVEL